jgi:double-stranded uracil-DNA glycosylase
MPRILRDRIGPGVRVLFVGINPGIRSAAIGHHFAGYSNRFWKLLYDAGLVPESIGTEEDARLVEWGFGITNLIPRATPGIDTLRPDEYAAGLRVLRRKVRQWKPDVVAFVGVTLYRMVFLKPIRGPAKAGRHMQHTESADATPPRFALGLQSKQFEGARVFVLPNPSGRNANFSYQQMLAAFRELREWLQRTPTSRTVRQL